MKTLIQKTLLAAAVTASLGLVSTTASAAFLPFTVAEGSVVGTPTNNVNAGKIIGNYTEEVTLQKDGTFTTAILFNGASFGTVDGNTIKGSFLSAAAPGFAAPTNYGLYATLTGGGTYSVAGGITTFTFVPSGNLTVKIDPTNDTTFNNIAATGNFGDDYTIATGAVVKGSGKLDNSCTPTDTINCGSFGTTTSLLLTELGKQFFVSPDPFYTLALESGQFDFIDVNKTGTAQTTTGSLDVTFNGTPVPEPESIALFGIGLLGLGLGLRRRKQA